MVCVPVDLTKLRALVAPLVLLIVDVPAIDRSPERLSVVLPAVETPLKSIRPTPVRLKLPEMFTTAVPELVPVPEPIKFIVSETIIEPKFPVNVPVEVDNLRLFLPSNPAVLPVLMILKVPLTVVRLPPNCMALAWFGQL